MFNSFGRFAPLVGLVGILVLLAGLLLAALALVGDNSSQETSQAATGDVAPADQQGHTGSHDHGGDHPGDQQVSAAQQEAADKLISDTKADTARFEDYEVARAEGYEPLKGEGGEQPGSFLPMHLVNQAYVEDGKLLDPERPESLVYLKDRDGKMDLIGAMYVAPRGEGPQIGGALTQWHSHDDLCISRDKTGAADLSSQTGGCPEGSWSVGDFEMMHVWLFDHPGGPFSPDMDPKDLSAAVGAGV